MLFVPWQYIADWRCNACGLCCKTYSVVLNFQEWLNIIKNYGVETTASGLNKLYIKRKGDGSCTFLYNISNAYLCGLQHMKPKACKLWPFKVLNKPEYGYAKEAAYDYKGSRLFVYADSTCSGLKYGRPTWEFTTYTVKEFIEIALGVRNQQFKSTADLGLLQPYVQPRRLNFYYRV